MKGLLIQAPVFMSFFFAVSYTYVPLQLFLAPYFLYRYYFHSLPIVDIKHGRKGPVNERRWNIVVYWFDYYRFSLPASCANRTDLLGYSGGVHFGYFNSVLWFSFCHCEIYLVYPASILECLFSSGIKLPLPIKWKPPQAAVDDHILLSCVLWSEPKFTTIWSI